MRADHMPGHWPDLSDQDVPAPETTGRLRLLRTAGLLALAVGVLYLTWRIFVTVPGATWWLAWPLVLLEVHSLLTFCLYLHVLWHPGYLRPPPPVIASRLGISVLIPTYNEPPEVLLPTLAAAAALPEPQSVWVLDDGDRRWVREMAAALSVTYRARATHEHAKAGNINAVLPDIPTELIAVLDADHVVRSDFLRNVLGYFDDPRVALVQLPQSFYNTDSFEHMHWPPGRRFAEQDLFYRLLAEARNRWGAAFWCGTNSVVRLSALREVGGVATQSVTEDIHTTVRLHRAGHRTVYHNEVLAQGLAAVNSEQYLNQRLRWGTGAMQVLRADNPLSDPALTWHQRLSYASTLLGWFDSWWTLGFVLLPMMTLFTGALPASAPVTTFLAVFVLAWLSQRVATQLLARGRAPLWPSTVFEFIRMPAGLRATTALLSARPRPFTVTDKGRTDDARRSMPTPRLLVALLVVSVVSSVWYAATLIGFTPVTYPIPWVAHAAALWVGFNAAFVTGALIRIRSPQFGSERRAAVRFRAMGGVALDGNQAEVEDVSLTGLRAITRQPLDLGSVVSVDLSPLTPDPLKAVVRSSRTTGSGAVVGLEFVEMTIRLRARLALHLFQTGLSPTIVPLRPHDTPVDDQRHPEYVSLERMLTAG